MKVSRSSAAFCCLKKVGMGAAGGNHYRKPSFTLPVVGEVREGRASLAGQPSSPLPAHSTLHILLQRQVIRIIRGLSFTVLLSFFFRFIKKEIFYKHSLFSFNIIVCKNTTKSRIISFVSLAGICQTHENN